MRAYVRSGIETMIGEALGLRRGFGNWSVEKRNSEVYEQISEIAKRTATDILKDVRFDLTDREKKAVLKTVRKAFIDKLHEEAWCAAQTVAERYITDMIDDMIDTWIPKEDE